MTLCGGSRDAPRDTIPKTNIGRDAGPSTALAGYPTTTVVRLVTGSASHLVERVYYMHRLRRKYYGEEHHSCSDKEDHRRNLCNGACYRDVFAPTNTVTPTVHAAAGDDWRVND